jgi:hypothetical protein
VDWLEGLHFCLQLVAPTALLGKRASAFSSAPLGHTFGEGDEVIGGESKNEELKVFACAGRSFIYAFGRIIPVDSIHSVMPLDKHRDPQRSECYVFLRDADSVSLKIPCTSEQLASVMSSHGNPH